MRHLAALLACLLILLPTGVRATAQTPDRLRLDSETVSLNTNPLDAYLRAHPKALPPGAVISSANWRGYVATFAVEDGQLVLERVSMAFNRSGKRGERKTWTCCRGCFRGRRRCPRRGTRERW